MKKIFYTAAIAAVTLSLAACGGKGSDTASDENKNDETATPATNVSTEGETVVEGEMVAVEQSSSSEKEDMVTPPNDEEETSNTSTGATYFTSAELDKFIADGTSDNIDRMISALEWYNKVRATLKPEVRKLNEDAIKAAAELEKAGEEIGDQYDAFSISGALDNKTGGMSESQLDRYNSVTTVLFFTADDSGSPEVQKYNELYRKYRYGSPF